MPKLSVRAETWPIQGHFTIARGRRTEAHVVVVSLEEGGVVGRGECVPYPRYGESVEGVIAAIEDLTGAIASGLTREDLQDALPAGAARNALDCAFWDLKARKTGTPVWQMLGLTEPVPRDTAYTISVDTPDAMGAQAAQHAKRPLLKIKLSGEGDADRLNAIRDAAPQARLVVDANEAWSIDQLRTLGPLCADLGVELIEQPLPAGEDAALADIDCPVPLCADESFHDFSTLETVSKLYQAVNVKLDKTGGLTEAVRITRRLRDLDMKVFVGCMVGTSLSMAPAFLLTGEADYIDLDAPLLLARDREHGLTFEGSRLSPPSAELWGSQ